MTIDLIPESVKKFWNEWIIQSFLILSFSLQMFLVIFAPFRKKTSNKWISFLIWSGYLLAEWAATFAIGLIFRSQGDNDSAFADAGSLMAFWSSFLLLHLGGPDTITAFALADNVLWVRHLLGLVVHLSAAVYVFLCALPKDKLMVPTILMLIAGVIKYLERVRALFLASLDKLQESDEPRQHRTLRSQIALSTKRVPLEEEKLIWTSYNYFKVFQGLIVDLYLAWSKRRQSRKFFRSTTAEYALRVILTELNFMYEVLYTKVVVVRSKLGYLLRAISFSIVICALALFVRVEKHRFHHVDVLVTYILLFGAAALEVTSLLMLIFSEWTLVSILKRIEHRNMIKERKSDSVLDHYFSRLDHYFSRILSCVLSLKKPTWSKHGIGPDDVKYEFGTRVVFRRWSESISGCNLISYSMSQRPARKIRKSCWGCSSLFTGKILCFLVTISI
ncbi:hypothetical protein CDL15_Pgr016945 [Punica granatum]|uniref:DUF4220 domain-containing protein n=1 Tax=Punica granatum TaxID=22663 RepID=A0A218WXM6_PUNGR|nr:hypothetical protein CDL15_Pgr016945 [Punica granatum]PKI33739.1 hypothetical protein CRG98_045861 [Punica granatum]